MHISKTTLKTIHKVHTQTHLKAIFQAHREQIADHEDGIA